MKNIKLIYNPSSGDTAFKNSLDGVIEIFQNAGYDVSVTRLGNGVPVSNGLRGDFSAVAVSGGDGTLNRLVNAMAEQGISVPVGIIPSGTANDFATHLKIPQNPLKAAEIIAAGKTMPADLGKVNDKYFVNVFTAGILTTVSRQTDENIKHVLGKSAYYLKGVEQAAKLKPMPVRVEADEILFEEELFIFLVLNSSGTGGFRELSPASSVCDGVFDFIGVKAKSLPETAALFLKILARNFLNDPNIIYFQAKNLKITPLFTEKELLQTDTDGEEGPELPAIVENIPGAVQIFVP
jgi:YegS/Rv2252/BmrU family lipid kinase